MKAQKTKARIVNVSQSTYKAVDDWFRELKMTSSGVTRKTVMFEPGKSKRPTGRWCNTVKRFYEGFGEKVQSHDFRVTFATQLYDATDKNLRKVQDYMGQANINTTAGYVRTSQ